MGGDIVRLEGFSVNSAGDKSDGGGSDGDREGALNCAVTGAVGSVSAQECSLLFFMVRCLNF